MIKIILSKNKKIVYIFIFILINLFIAQIITIKKFILYNKLKSEVNTKNLTLCKKIENYNNYKKNIDKILNFKNTDDLYIVELQDLNSIILSFNDILKSKNLKENNIEIGYKQLVKDYKNRKIVKIPIKIICSGKYNNIVEYIGYLESINKFITIDNIKLNLKGETKEMEIEDFDLEIYLYILALEDNKNV